MLEKVKARVMAVPPIPRLKVLPANIKSGVYDFKDRKVTDAAKSTARRFHTENVAAFHRTRDRVKRAVYRAKMGMSVIRRKFSVTITPR